MFVCVHIPLREINNNKKKQSMRHERNVMYKIGDIVSLRSCVERVVCVHLEVNLSCGDDHQLVAVAYHCSHLWRHWRALSSMLPVSMTWLCLLPTSPAGRPTGSASLSSDLRSTRAWWSQHTGHCCGRSDSPRRCNRPCSRIDT